MALSRCGHSDPGLQKHGNDGVEIEKKNKMKFRTRRPMLMISQHTNHVCD